MAPTTTRNSSTGTKRGLRQPAAQAHSLPPSVEGGTQAGMRQATRNCSLCADELDALGLPYRILLRCTHE